MSCHVRVHVGFAATEVEPAQDLGVLVDDLLVFRQRVRLQEADDVAVVEVHHTRLKSSRKSSPKILVLSLDSI